MNKFSKKESADYFYEVIGQKTIEERTYRLVRFSLAKTSTSARRKNIEQILEKENVIGLLEWWLRGSIVQKPKWQFYGVLICAQSNGK